MQLSDFDEQSNLNFTYFYRRALLSGDFKILKSCDLEKMCQRGIINISEGQVCLTEYGKTLLQKNGFTLKTEHVSEKMSTAQIEELALISDSNFANNFRTELLNKHFKNIPCRLRSRLRHKHIINLRYNGHAKPFFELTDYGRKLLELEPPIVQEPQPKQIEVEVQKSAHHTHETRHISEAHKQAISKKLKGRVFSPETIEKMRQSASRPRPDVAEALRGRHLSEAHRANIGAGVHAGNKHTPMSEEGKQHISEAKKGKPLSATHRLHLTKAWRLAQSSS